MSSCPRDGAVSAAPQSMLQNISVSAITPDPDQPRKHFAPAALADLAQSMEVNGLAVPVLVRPVGETFMLVHGERRYRAALSLGWETIPAEVRPMSENQARRVALIENIQRESLTAIEEARALETLLQTGLTQAQLGKQIGKGQSYIAQKLRLLKLPAPLAVLVGHGAITENHVRQILKLKTWYRGAQINIPPREPREDDAESLLDLSPEELSHSLLWLRPLDALWPTPVTPEKAPVIRETLDALAQRLPSEGGPVESWVRIATWFGCCAYTGALSVADLAGLLDRFREQLYAAVFEVYVLKNHTDGDPPKPNTTGWAHFWGYRSDARHAGIPRDPPDELIRHVRDWGNHLLIEAHSSWLIPSNCQEGMQYAEQYRAARAKEGYV